ncbi:CU044_2847 family protein [Sphaerisporangium sp. B11E5]|uniref:CU044_2847 family protein n=1 Tax=Sphaerisporangium sp. B11E5 TaxID=3153563 RepID=UPI00325CA337
MSELLRVPLEGGGYFLAETSADGVGPERAARPGKIVSAGIASLEEALQPVRDAARATLATFRGTGPDEVEIEFGVKITAEAGAVIARTGVEGHLVVKLIWREAPE